MVLGLSTPVGLGNPVTNVATIVTTVCPALQTVKTTLAASPFGFILGLFINPIISQLRTVSIVYQS